MELQQIATQYVSRHFQKAALRLIDFLNQEAQKNSSVGDTLNKIISGEKVIKEAHHFFRKKFVTNGAPGAGITEIIKLQDAKKDGEISFDKAKLSPGEVFSASHVRLAFAQDGAAGGKEPAEMLFSNNIYNPASYAAGTVDLDSGGTGNQFAPVEVQLIPNRIINAEVRLKFAGDIFLNSLFGTFCKANKLNNSNGIHAFDQGNVKELGVPKIFTDSGNLGLDLVIPAGAALATADYFIDYELFGVTVVDRAQ